LTVEPRPGQQNQRQLQPEHKVERWISWVPPFVSVRQKVRPNKEQHQRPRSGEIAEIFRPWSENLSLPEKFPRHDGRLDAVAQVQLLQDRRHVVLDRFFLKTKLIPDFAVAVALGNKA
jgi:hypothetical protein